MARTPEKLIENPFVEELMNMLDCNGSYTEASRRTGIPESTWRNWARGQGSPLTFLEQAYILQIQSGKKLEDLVAMGRKLNKP